MEKLAEHTNGTHIYMRMRLDNGQTEEIDVYLINDGEYYITSANHGMNFYTGKELEEKQKLRSEIIQAFNALY